MSDFRVTIPICAPAKRELRKATRRAFRIAGHAGRREPRPPWKSAARFNTAACSRSRSTRPSGSRSKRLDKNSSGDCLAGRSQERIAQRERIEDVRVEQHLERGNQHANRRRAYFGSSPGAPERLQAVQRSLAIADLLARRSRVKGRGYPDRQSPMRRAAWRASPADSRESRISPATVTASTSAGFVERMKSVRTETKRKGLSR